MSFVSRDLTVKIYASNGCGCTNTPPDCTPTNAPCGCTNTPPTPAPPPCTPTPGGGGPKKPKEALGVLRQQLREALIQP